MTDKSAVVLIVDDEAADVKSIGEALRSAGFGVLDSDSYDTALQQFDSHQGDIDLLVADVSLPGKTGIELARLLLRRKPNLKVLFVSGHVRAEVIRFHGLPASDHHFLQKPLRAEDLVRRAKELLKSSDPLDWLEPKKTQGASDNQKRM